MGYVQALALLPDATQTYIADLMATVGLDAPDAIIAAIVDGVTPTDLSAMTSGEIALHAGGLASGSPLALEQLLTLGTIPAAVTTFNGLL
jgi:hypothetical protein